MPGRAWKDIASRTWKRTWSDNVGLVAAGVTYYGFLAIVPLLGIIVLAYGIFADTQTVVANVRLLTGILPSDVASQIGDQLLSAVRSSGKVKGFGILIAVVVALYGGTNGAGAILTALNIAYEEKEKRSLLHFYALAAVITVGAVAVAVAALVATTAVVLIGSLSPYRSSVAVTLGTIAGYIALSLAAAAIAATLYRYGPSREKARWTWITPGSLFAAAAWLVLTLAFGFYVGNVTNYNLTYGSLGTIVALLTWIYLSAYALIFGAELNSEIEHQTAKDSTTGSSRRIGRRGAWAADNVAYDDEPDEDQAPSLAEATPDPPKTKTKKR